MYSEWTAYLRERNITVLDIIGNHDKFEAVPFDHNLLFDRYSSSAHLGLERNFALFVDKPFGRYSLIGIDQAVSNMYLINFSTWV